MHSYFTIKRLQRPSNIFQKAGLITILLQKYWVILLHTNLCRTSTVNLYTLGCKHVPCCGAGRFSWPRTTRAIHEGSLEAQTTRDRTNSRKQFTLRHPPCTYMLDLGLNDWSSPVSPSHSPHKLSSLERYVHMLCTMIQKFHTLHSEQQPGTVVVFSISFPTLHLFLLN
jgi:hypothetical protein